MDSWRVGCSGVDGTELRQVASRLGRWASARQLSPGSARPARRLGPGPGQARVAAPSTGTGAGPAWLHARGPGRSSPVYRCMPGLVPWPWAVS